MSGSDTRPEIGSEDRPILRSRSIYSVFRRALLVLSLWVCSAKWKNELKSKPKEEQTKTKTTRRNEQEKSTATE